MPREIPAIASGHMKNKMGIEMSIILGTEFGTFSTKETAGARGTILSIGECSVSQKADSMGSSGTVSISLADPDGQIKDAVDFNDLEGSRAILWQRYEGSGEDDQVLLLKGRIQGPVTWEERSRTVSFSVESYIWADQVGFAPTANDFPDLNPDAYGTAWPMLFGTVYHVPAVHVKKRAAGTLHTDIRLNAFPPYKIVNKNISLDVTVYVQTVFQGIVESSKIYVKNGERFPQGTPISLIIEGVIFEGKMDGEEFSVTRANAPKYTDVEIDSRNSDPLDPDIHNSNVLWIKPASTGRVPNLVNHHCYFRIASGTWYNYCTKQSGTKCWFRDKFISPTSNDSQVKSGDPTKAFGKELLMASGKVIKEVFQVSRNGFVKDMESTIALWRRNNVGRASVGDQSGWGLVVRSIEAMKDSSGGFWRAYADTEVRQWNGDPDIYVFSGVECSAVLGVYGKKIIQYMDGKQKKILAPIPKSFYTEQLASNYQLNGSTASALLFNDPLSDYKTPEGAEEWEDNIYVSAVSTVGPNIVDILEWLLNTFTDLKIGKSFAKVKTIINDTPANFALFDRRDALKLCEDIAWQARCALLTDSGVAELIFVAEKPHAEFQFNTTNTQFGSLKMGLTEVNEIETNFLGTWTANYEDTGAPDRHTESETLRLRHIIRGIDAADDHKTRVATDVQIYKENINLYGERTRDWAFFIFDDPDLVDTALAFWGHRKANSWKFIELNGFHDSMHLTTFDGVDINLPQIPAVRGVVQSTSFSPKDKTVSYRIWLPIRASHGSEDVDAWQI